MIKVSSLSYTVTNSEELAYKIIFQIGNCTISSLPLEDISS